MDEHLGKDLTVELACREIAISTAAYYKWRQRYDGMSVADAKELHELLRPYLRSTRDHHRLEGGI
jgi:hypothetical protein